MDTTIDMPKFIIGERDEQCLCLACGEPHSGETETNFCSDYCKRTLSYALQRPIMKIMSASGIWRCTDLKRHS